MSSRAEFVTHVDSILTSLDHARNVVAAVPNYNQVALVLSQTDCVATLPMHLLHRYVGFVDLLELPFAVPSFRLAMAWHPRTHGDPSSVWLRQCFTRACGLTDD